MAIEMLQFNASNVNQEKASISIDAKFFSEDEIDTLLNAFDERTVKSE